MHAWRERVHDEEKATTAKDDSSGTYREQEQDGRGRRNPLAPRPRRRRTKRDRRVVIMSSADGQKERKAEQRQEKPRRPYNCMCIVFDCVGFLHVGIPSLRPATLCFDHYASRLSPPPPPDPHPFPLPSPIGIPLLPLCLVCHYPHRLNFTHYVREGTLGAAATRPLGPAPTHQIKLTSHHTN